AQNLTMAIMPPLSLFVLDATGLHGVAAVIAGFVAVGMLLVIRLERNLARVGGPAFGRDGDRAATRPRWIGFAWRPAWSLPLLIVVAMTIHWGVITSYF